MSAVYVDLLFRKAQLHAALQRDGRGRSTPSAALVDRAVPSLREPIPGSLFLNYHVVADKRDAGLVTGGAGFIGSNLVRALLERGDDVRVLDNFSTGRRTNLDRAGGDVEIVEGELRSYERVHAAVRGVELVFHLGALGSVPRSVQDPLTTSAVNVEGTLNVLLAARDEGVRRVVFASSSSVYGNARRAAADASRCRPTRSRPTASRSSPRSATA